MRLPDIVRQFFAKHEDWRLRDNTAYNVSDLGKDARDLYWRRTGVPPTESRDALSKIRMMMGSAIERMIVQEVLMKCDFLGLHCYDKGRQIAVGSLEWVTVGDVKVPLLFNGYMDNVAVLRKGDVYSCPIVIEIKSKNLTGAASFVKSFDPGTNYLLQIAYYMKEVAAKKGQCVGNFIFLTLGQGDDYGNLFFLDVVYDPKTMTCTLVRAEDLFGVHEPRALNISVNLGVELQRMAGIELCVQRQQLPAAEHYYKQPLTREAMAEWSDKEFQDALSGRKVIGDWQISYSDYKAKHIEAEGTSLGYTAQELVQIALVYQDRTPKSTLAKKILAQHGELVQPITGEE